MLRVADMTRSGGDLVNAVGLYQRAHELAPQDERPLIALGQIFAQLGSPASAAEAYRAAVAAAPSDVEARRGLGTALIAMGQSDVAITELEKALDIAKDYRIYNSLGVAYDMTGDHASAQTYYQTGLDALAGQPRAQQQSRPLAGAGRALRRGDRAAREDLQRPERAVALPAEPGARFRPCRQPRQGPPSGAAGSRLRDGGKEPELFRRAQGAWRRPHHGGRAGRAYAGRR